MRAWDRWWHAPSSAHSLAACRVILALAALWLVRHEHPALPGRLLAHVSSMPAGLWRPAGVLQLVPWRPTEAVASVVAWAAVASSLTTLLGVWTRLSSAVMALCMTLLLGWAQSWGRIVHDANLPTLLWWTLALTPSGDVWSWDARGRSAPPPDGAYTWGVRLLRLNVSMMWLLAGLNKVAYGGVAWLKPANLQTILRSVNLADPYREASATALWIADHPWLCSALATGTVTLELGFVGVLFVASNRARLVFVGGAFAFLVGAALWLHLPQPAHMLVLLVCLDWGALTGGAPEPAPVAWTGHR